MMFAKGNLAHKCMCHHFSYFLIPLDIFKALKMKILKILVNLRATGGRKSNFEIHLVNFGFQNDSLCDVIIFGNSLSR